jgi:hypothetical protein
MQQSSLRKIIHPIFWPITTVISTVINTHLKQWVDRASYIVMKWMSQFWSRIYFQRVNRILNLSNSWLYIVKSLLVSCLHYYEYEANIYFYMKLAKYRFQHLRVMTAIYSKNRCIQLHTKVCLITHQGEFNYTPRCVHLTHLHTQF